jgi:hypothetical protein
MQRVTCPLLLVMVLLLLQGVDDAEERARLERVHHRVMSEHYRRVQGVFSSYGMPARKDGGPVHADGDDVAEEVEEEAGVVDGELEDDVITQGRQRRRSSLGPAREVEEDLERAAAEEQRRREEHARHVREELEHERGNVPDVAALEVDDSLGESEERRRMRSTANAAAVSEIMASVLEASADSASGGGGGGGGGRRGDGGAAEVTVSGRSGHAPAVSSPVGGASEWTVAPDDSGAGDEASAPIAPPPVAPQPSLSVLDDGGGADGDVLVAGASGELSILGGGASGIVPDVDGGGSLHELSDGQWAHESTVSQGDVVSVSVTCVWMCVCVCVLVRKSLPPPFAHTLNSYTPSLTVASRQSLCCVVVSCCPRCGFLNIVACSCVTVSLHVSSGDVDDVLSTRRVRAVRGVCSGRRDERVVDGGRRGSFHQGQEARAAAEQGCCRVASKHREAAATAAAAPACTGSGRRSIVTALCGDVPCSVLCACCSVFDAPCPVSVPCTPRSMRWSWPRVASAAFVRVLTLVLTPCVPCSVLSCSVMACAPCPR